ncbi:branched-chain amino acid ABC transporter substrate-binding protein [Donghicola sp. C2-DW-16]|uniref:Branched-chain amino acid ABC transporter substrate-binding protein n=1 Tax=Donghicola mangrovi TaxID=2729614 RepID=A0ABX2PIF3_9RHOB|nr:branched-chain amino acid ABC transporter substrate-binding protein [Donghicola mangrovi]NVO29292.1 branched-chain amino acid ABC transporter substrate-binding protein [Donghicola mangrovi]
MNTLIFARRLASLRNRFLTGAGLGAIAAMMSVTQPALADINIGVAGSLTGSSAFSGEKQEIGARAAIDDINAAGGVLGQQLHPLLVDDACDPHQAEAAAQQLISAGAAVVVGHNCSGATVAAMGLYEQANLLMISPAATNPRVTDEGGDNVFRVSGRDDEQAAIAATLIKDRFPNARIGIVNNEGVYGQGLTNSLISELGSRGIEPVLVTTFQPGSDDYYGLVDSFVASDLDVLYFASNMATDVGLIALQSREQLPDVQFIGADALAADSYMLVAEDAGVGTLFTFGVDARELDSAKEVAERIRETAFYEPSGYTLYTYAVLQVWADAVRIAGSTETAAVAKAMHENTFDTVMGTIGFDEKGDVTGIQSFLFYEYGPDGYAPVN